MSLSSAKRASPVVGRALLLYAALGGLAALACSDQGGSERAPAKSSARVAHVEGEQLVDPKGKPLALEGITLGNLWGEPADPRDNHDATDYARIAELGMNYARLGFKTNELEDDSAPGEYKPEGLAWLDDNVAWARANGISLILAMNVPPGGGTFDCDNDPFWEGPDYQDRWIAIWRMLAARYAGESSILGYSPLDMINPNEALEQWHELADRVTDAIREVDPDHTLFISRAISIACQFDKPAAESFVRLRAPNVVYEFDRTQPWDYVTQLTAPPSSAEPTLKSEYGPYPNESNLSIDHSKAQYLHDSSMDSRPAAADLTLTPDDTEWTKKVFYYTITEPKFQYAQLVLDGAHNPGKAYFDDILVEEVRDDGDRVIRHSDMETVADWYLWEADQDANETKGTGVVTLESDAHSGSGSISLGNTTSFYSQLTSSDGLLFLVNLGSTYRVTSWFKGEGIGPDTEARVTLSLWGYPEKLHPFDRDALDALFDDCQSWGRARGVPMNVSSFGTGRPTFEDDRGGLDWVSDMIDVMRARKLGFTYWGYHEQIFGIYTNPTGLPDPETVNQPLLDLLSEKLH